MAGTLTISTLSDGTNSTSSTNCIKGSAKAWVHFSMAGGAVGAITQAFNVSSVTLTGTGTFTVTYTNALTTTYPAIMGSVDQGALMFNGNTFGGSTTTSSAISTWNTNTAGGYTPTTGISFAAFSV